MIHRFDLASARAAAEARVVSDWITAYLLDPSLEHRGLASIIKGQNPIWEGPIEVELAKLFRIAGPGPSFQYAKDPKIWRAEVEALAAKIADVQELPPLIVRDQPGGLHLSDGNHRADALSLLGYDRAWAFVWHDRDPIFTGVFSPWSPNRKPTIATAEGLGRVRAVEFYRQNVRGLIPADDEILVTAESPDGAVVGAVRLAPEAGAWTLRTMLVVPEYRGLRLGARILNHLAPHMEGKRVHCLAYGHLARFYGEFGFKPIAPNELPSLLRIRFAEYQDERGCLALVRNG